MALASSKQLRQADAASAIEEAEDDYYAVTNPLWATIDYITGSYDMTAIYEAAKQYAVDVAFAGVALTRASGDATVQYTGGTVEAQAMY